MCITEPLRSRQNLLEFEVDSSLVPCAPLFIFTRFGITILKESHYLRTLQSDQMQLNKW
jgi:hypothetical protein